MLEGIHPMVVTPFDSRGAVLLDDLVPLIEAMLNQGAAGIATLGLGGEAGSLTFAERESITRAVCSATPEGVPVTVAVSADDTLTCCRLGEVAAESGATAVAVAPPSERDMTREGLLDHYRTVAGAVAPTPLMIQDAPAFVGVALDVDFVGQLTRELSNVRLAKTEATPVGDAVRELAAVPGITVLGGHAGLHARDALDAGAAGLIPGCEVTHELSRLWRAHRGGERGEVANIHRALLPLLNFMFQSLPFYLACTKALLAARGLLSTERGRASAPLSAAGRATLISYAREAGIA